MTRSLVTGGNGYLGTELVKQLANLGHSIVSLDLEIPSKQIENVKYISVDIAHEEDLVRLFKNHKFDKVFHFAGISSLSEASDDFSRTISVNSLSTLNILKHMHENGIRHLIYASSMYVFSETGGTYRLSKQISEQIIEDFSRNFPLFPTIIRFGSIYGPGSNDSNGIHEIIKHALTMSTIKYSGDPESMREYIHISDAIRACIEIADSKESESKVFLVTGDRLMRVYDVLLIIKEMLGNKKIIEFENRNDSGHYIATPYSYKPKTAIKYQLKNSTDLSQGLWELIHHIANSEDNLKTNGEL